MVMEMMVMIAGYSGRDGDGNCYRNCDGDSEIRGMVTEIAEELV